MWQNILILSALPKTDEQKSIYEALVVCAKEFAHTILSPIDTLQFTGSDRDRYERAFRCVREAELVIGEQSHPSTGQGMEIRECALHNIPIIVVARS